MNNDAPVDSLHAPGSLCFEILVTPSSSHILRGLVSCGPATSVASASLPQAETSGIHHMSRD